MSKMLNYLTASLLLALMLPATAPAVDFPLPDTGQTKCYNDSVEIPCPFPGQPFYGQDAQYRGAQPAYQDNGNGTVTDKVTGLMWQQQDDGTERAWQDAMGYCDNLTLGGYDDWRLPEIFELETLVDYSIPLPGPTINMSYFPNTVSTYYWSSTTYATYTDNAWLVNFNASSVYYLNKPGSRCARCVRGGQVRSFGHLTILDPQADMPKRGAAARAFVDEGDGTVSDADTNLMWQQQNDGTERTWQAALAYCEDLTLGGYEDWRLPNIRELKSILDYTHFNPAIDMSYFPNTVSSSYWSSTTNVYLTDGAWSQRFDDGSGAYTNGKSGSCYVRCVRGGQGGPFDHLTLSVSKTGSGSGMVTSEPVGIDCGATCTNGYEPDTVVTLTARADGGSLFSGWFGACSGADATCSLTMDEDTSVTAAFELKPTPAPSGVPTVNTTALTAITSSSALSGGQVTADNGTEVTARGVCWSSADSLPTIEHADCMAVGGGMGEFSGKLTPLKPRTPYHARAFAVNSAGAGYGQAVAFTTKPAKAIIVAGSGPYAGNVLWAATQFCTQWAYDALRKQGLKKEDLYFLSNDHAVDLDENGFLDDVAGDATGADLQHGIQTWAAGAGDVLIYLTGHGGMDGGQGTYQIAADELVRADQLNQWLDVLQPKVAGTVAVVYDACRSGSFIPLLAASKRVVVASADMAQQAWFGADGTLSFSYFLWTHLYQGRAFYDALSAAQKAVEEAVAQQYIQMEADGDGIANEQNDRQALADVHFGNESKSAANAPLIGKVSPAQILEPGQSEADFWVKEVISANGITGVWAVIFSPAQIQQSLDEPVVDQPRVTLQPVPGEAGHYTGRYTGFTTPGQYRIAIYAQDNSALGLVSEPAFTLVSTAGASACLPRISANGQDKTVTVSPGETVTLAVSLHAGPDAGKLADWWLLSLGPDGQWRYLDLTSWQFEPGLKALFHSWLFDIVDPLAVSSMEYLEPGAHLFFFALDNTANGALDAASLAYDMVTVTVRGGQ